MRFGRFDSILSVDLVLNVHDRHGTVHARKTISATIIEADIRFHPVELAVNPDGEQLTLHWISLISQQGRLVMTSDIPPTTFVAPGTLIVTCNYHPSADMVRMYAAVNEEYVEPAMSPDSRFRVSDRLPNSFAIERST